MRKSSLATNLLACLSLVLSAAAQAPATTNKPTLEPEDYGRWEQLGRQASLSPDGSWLAFDLSKVNGDFELRLREVEAKEARVIPWGRSPVFSNNGRWLAWSIGVSEKERERLSKAKKPVQNGAGLLELGGESEQKFAGISRFRFDEGGRFLALLGYPPEDSPGQGASLQLLDLEQGSQLTLGNVTDFAWSELAPLLAITIGTGQDAGNGVQLYDGRTGRITGLEASESTYRRLTWREDADDLALLRSLDKASEKGKAHSLLAWTGLAGDAPAELVFDLDLIEAGYEIVEHGGPTWSEKGDKIAFGLRPEEEEEEPEAEDEESAEDKKAKTDLPALQIWHSSDVRIFPGQKSRSGADSRRTLLTVWQPAKQQITRLGSDLQESCQLIGDWQHAIERVQAPYPWGQKFGRRYHDLYRIEVDTGARQKVLERVRYSYASVGGRYLLWFDGEHYWTHDLDSGAEQNITKGLDTAFANLEYDTPTDLLPPQGLAGWLQDDAAVLLYDRFDTWRVAADGSGGHRITRGDEGRIVHRLLDLDREEPAIDASGPLYFSLRGEDSEERGFARLQPGAESAEQLILSDKMLSNLQKAEEQDAYLYRVGARDDSPDYFLAGADLAEPRQVSNTNPFQSEYAWTRSELIDFTSEAGADLQATLLYPANHDPSRQYPMIVYTYEILAPQIHRYKAPDERGYYNETVWTQEGYFVLFPDIVYRPREPGTCAIEAVRPAVAKIVDRGLVDKDRVGLIGHSWGGYNATYLPTRIDTFAASVAGAPLTDFVSFMGQIHWSSGTPEVDHWETGQARMEVPFWEDPEAHRRNSPVHGVPTLNTPILMAFGDDDGAVDWDQGTEFYNFVRRAEKQMVLLVYEGEGHGFRKKANQIDYHRRILEWFGHYLKGEPAPKWIAEGIPYADQEEERRRVAEKK